MEANVAELIAFLTETLKQGVSFAQEQLPVWVDQILRYGLVSSTINASIAFVVVITWLVSFILVHRRSVQEGVSVLDWGVGFFISTFGTIIGIVSFIWFVTELILIVKISIAPSLYLLQIAQSL